MHEVATSMKEEEGTELFLKVINFIWFILFQRPPLIFKIDGVIWNRPKELYTELFNIWRSNYVDKSQISICCYNKFIIKSAQEEQNCSTEIEKINHTTSELNQNDIKENSSTCLFDDYEPIDLHHKDETEVVKTIHWNINNAMNSSNLIFYS